MPSCSATHICGHVCFKGPAKSWTSLLGFVQFVWHVVQVLRRWGAVTMVGGSSDPSVPWSPGVTLQEKAGRPMGPSTLRCEFPWEVVVVYVGFLFFVLQVFCLFLVMPLLFLRGRFFVFVPLSPSRPDPCLVFVCVRLLFSVWLVSSATFLSLSLSQALGNPKPFWFGVPLVFLHPGHALRPRSVRLPLHLHPGFAPHLFFFSSSSLVSGSVFSRFLSCRCRWSWWVVFCPWSWSLSGCCFLPSLASCISSCA